MSAAVIALLVVGAIVVLALMFGVSIYNQLVVLRNRLENAFSQIEVQLKRRYDLIPNLVEAVKGYMAHERGTLEAVISARNQAMGAVKAAAAKPGDPSAMNELAAAENSLGGALSRLMMVAEAYPDLKANQNMAQLTEELKSTENKVAFARQAYNDSVMQYNTYRQSFPPVIFAGLFGHGEDAELLEFDSKQIAEAPKVSF